jgi:phosphoglucosamine mutase
VWSSLGKLFGTDGVRGVANKDLTPELAYRLGRAGTAILAKDTSRPKILIGKDTRISGDMLEAALSAGICSVGGDVIQVGVVPTPAVAYLTQVLGANAGIVISASHNPVDDNGIKFFYADGYKLPDEVEDAIEEKLNEADEATGPTGADVGRIYQSPDAYKEYIRYVISTVQERFDGMRIVVDCANGAASMIAPAVYEAMGAQVIPIYNTPDGSNINDGCGSTHPEVLQRKVIEEKADIGFTHDGDADRVLACDHLGNLVDGDQILTICGLDLLQKNMLPQNTIVATVMSNLGLDMAFRQAGGKVLRAKVGDRYVLEEMKKNGLVLGGEQSGHVIFLNHNTTGDGVMTAIQLLGAVRRSGKTLFELASQFKRLPQALENIQVVNKEAINGNERIAQAVEEVTKQLGDRGRILIRPSGTEPKVRVMVECEDEEELKSIMDRMTALVRIELS